MASGLVVERAKRQSQLTVASSEYGQGGLEGTGLGASPSRSRQSGKSRQWRSRALLETSVLKASIKADHVARHQVGNHRYDSLGSDGQHGKRQAVVSRENRQIRPNEQLADLVERAGGFLDGDDGPDLGQALDRLWLDVTASPAGNIVEHKRDVDALRDCREMAEHAFLVRTIVVRRDQQGPSAPARAANRVSRIASAVEFDPVPAMTLARPAADSTTRAMTRSCSSCVSVGDSPVVPTGLSMGVPSATCQSTSERSAASSTAPSRNGVTRATVQPANIRPFLAMPEPRKTNNQPSPGSIGHQSLLGFGANPRSFAGFPDAIIAR